VKLSRPTKFFIFEKLLLPVAVLPFRQLIKTWRVQNPEAAKMQEIAATKRLVLATYHGMFFHLLAFAPLAVQHGRRLVVMTSPSYDGRLLKALLRRFGIDSVSGSSASRSVAGTGEFIRRIQAGDIGLIAVDGPRGPRCMVKPGFVKMAAVARAQLLLVATSASYGVTFKTWDRAHLPGPFARVDLVLDLLPSPSADNVRQRLSSAPARLQALARQIASPVLVDPAQENRPDQT
jgi:lysophospholipid acyltransferase (LPLAT)-like uncharacterized protein